MRKKYIHTLTGRKPTDRAHWAESMNPRFVPGGRALKHDNTLSSRMTNEAQVWFGRTSCKAQPHFGLEEASLRVGKEMEMKNGEQE